MVLVDPRVLNSLSTTQKSEIPDAAMESLRKMDQDMKDLLKTDDGDKLKDYEQTLWRYLKRLKDVRERPLGTVKIEQSEKFVSPSTTTTTTTSDAAADAAAAALTATTTTTTSDEEILESVPKRMRHKASLLMKYIRNNPQKLIKWTPRGELEYQGQVIKNSNFVDLVNDVLRNRKRQDPIGWKAFATALQSMNVPQEFIGNPRRREFINKDPSEISMGEEKETIVEETRRRRKHGGGGGSKKEKKKIKWTPY